jgi:hypothetical protein
MVSQFFHSSIICRIAPPSAPPSNDSRATSTATPHREQSAPRAPIAGGGSNPRRLSKYILSLLEDEMNTLALLIGILMLLILAVGMAVSIRKTTDQTSAEIRAGLTADQITYFKRCSRIIDDDRR